MIKPISTYISSCMDNYEVLGYLHYYYNISKLVFALFVLYLRDKVAIASKWIFKGYCAPLVLRLVRLSRLLVEAFARCS